MPAPRPTIVGALLLATLLSAMAAIGQSPEATFFQALSTGDVTKVRQMLRENPALANASNDSGGFPLHQRSGRLGIPRTTWKEIAEALLAAGADVNGRSSLQGRTPLHTAAWRGEDELLELLLAHGADINAKDSNGATPLDMALFQDVASRGKTAAVLLAHGAETNIFNAAALGDIRRIRELLSRNPSLVNARDQMHGGGNGLTPLHWAGLRRQEEAVGLLLSYTPLLDIFSASVTGDVDRVKRSLDRNPESVNQKDGRGLTPLHWAVNGGHKDVVELLLERGADVNTGRDINATPLQTAKRLGESEIVALLEAYQK